MSVTHSCFASAGILAPKTTRLHIGQCVIIFPFLCDPDYQDFLHSSESIRFSLPRDIFACSVAVVIEKE